MVSDAVATMLSAMLPVFVNSRSIELACLYFPNNKISAANNIIYVGSIIHNYTGDTEEGIINFQIMLSETIRASAAILKPGEKICHTYIKLQGNQSTIEDFIKDMDFISINPDDSIDYDPEAVRKAQQEKENQENPE